MQEIAAVWRGESGPEARETLARAVCRFHRPRSRRVRSWVSADLAVAATIPLSNGPVPSESPVPTDRHFVLIEGRIDNGADLRRELRLDAAASADRDVVAAAYARWNDDFAAHLIGDFSGLLWDGHRRALLAFVDALGVRELYYACTPAAVIVASRITAVRDALAAAPVVNAEFMHRFVAGDDFSAPGQTAYAGIQRVCGGRCLVIEPGRVRMVQYYELGQDRAEVPSDEQECARAFRSLLVDAVRARTAGLSTVASQLSGGIDSSAVVCVAHDLPLPAGGLRTYSSVYPSLLEGKDESPFIDAVLEACPRAHGVRLPSDRCFTFEEYAENSPFIPDEPDAVAHRQLQLRRFGAAVRDGCASMLTGFFGDQVMGGAGTYLQARWFRDLSLREQRRELRHFVEAQPSLARFLVRAYVRPWYESAGHHMAGPRPATFWEAGVHHSLVHASAMARRRYQRLGQELGIEILFPYLHRPLVEFMLNVPPRMRFRDGMPKHLIRQAVGSLMPPDVRGRRYGFGAGVAALTREGLARYRDSMRSRLAGGVLEQSGYVKRAVLRRTFDEPLDRPALKRLMRLISAEVWARRQAGD
jgi:asparagine synthase (glutamine-hydrolysing)